MYGLNLFEQIAIWSVLGVAICGLLYALFLRHQILKEDSGTKKMQEVWGAIREGANAYLRRQLKTILPFNLYINYRLIPVSLYRSSYPGSIFLVLHGN
jgi:K(+)-stimulated pyrophosphate-energized sodium pump